MKKIYEGRILEFGENGGRTLQKFYTVDELHVVGEDGDVYEILPLNEVINDEMEIVHEWTPITVYTDESNSVALNYAEDGTIKEYLQFYASKKGISLEELNNEQIVSIFETINEFSNTNSASNIEEALYIIGNK